MALNTEEGGTLTEAYASVEYADIYFSKRGNPEEYVSATTSDKEAALRYGCDYMNSQFSWKSNILSTLQSLAWPRVAYKDSEGRLIAAITPDKIKDANCEFALAYLRGEIFSPDLEGVLEESVGASSVKYASSAAKTHSAMKLSLSDYGWASKSSVSETFRG